MNGDDHFEQLRRAIVDSETETQHHVDMVSERLERKLQIVAECVIALSDRFDRLVDEMRNGFREIDHGFLHLEAGFERRFADIERRLAEG